MKSESINEQSNLSVGSNCCDKAQNDPGEEKVSPVDAVFIAVEMGESILQSGGEISRAEDTISRICKAYGAVKVDVGIILSVIVLTVDFGTESINSSRRILDVGTNNIGRLARLNALSRRICRELPTKSEFLSNLERVNTVSVVKVWQKILGAVLTACGFAVFFGGNLIDSVFSAVIVIPMTLLGVLLSGTKMNAIIAKFFVCFLGGFCAMLVAKTGVACNPDKIMIGDIMTVIPGVLLTNSFRDLFSGDVMSGFFRLCTAVLDAVAIACGYAMAILLLGGAS